MPALRTDRVLYAGEGPEGTATAPSAAAGPTRSSSALLRDAAREVLDSRAEWKAAEQRRRAKETEREQESTPRGGFFSGLFGGRDDDKPRKNQPPEF